MQPTEYNLERKDDTSYYIHKFETIVTGLWSSSPLLSVKIGHLVDRFDLFNIRNIFYDGREIVRSLTGTGYGGYSWSPNVTVKIDGLWNFSEQLTL